MRFEEVLITAPPTLRVLQPTGRAKKMGLGPGNRLLVELMDRHEQSEERKVPRRVESILTSRWSLILESFFVLVFIGAWVFDDLNPTRVIVGCLIFAVFVPGSIWIRRWWRNGLREIEESPTPVNPASARLRVVVWIAFVAVVAIGFWIGVQSELS